MPSRPRRGEFDGSAQEKDGKLHFVGTVKTEDDKNEVWNAIKTIPDWKNDIVADIKVTGGPARGGGQDLHGEERRHSQQDRQGAPRRRECLHEDLRANRDQLKDPDLIKPGQVLKLP